MRQEITIKEAKSVIGEDLHVITQAMNLLFPQVKPSVLIS